MARRLDASGYDHDTVAAAVRARVAHRPRVRFRVTDLYGNDANLDPQVFAAHVTFDSQRLITGSLTIEIEPLPALRRAPFKYVWWPEVGFGPMPNGGTAWLPYGAYLHTAPRRVIRRIASTNVERWVITMGDLNHALNLFGPGFTTFGVSQDSLVTEGIVRFLDRAGVEDVDAVEPSDDTAVESLVWNVRTGPRAVRRLTAGQYAQAMKVWKATLKLLAAARLNKKNVVAPDPPKPTRLIVRDQSERGIRWLDIGNVLHDLIAYNPPHRNMAGEYVARPAVDLAVAQPTIEYRTDRDSIIVSEPEVDPDLAGIANVVYVAAKENKLVNPGTVLGVANLDDIAPNHPLAPNQCGFITDDLITPASAMSQGAADLLARRELLASMLAWERVTIVVALNPEHEGFETPSLTITNDDEFSTSQIMAEQGWDADLFAGTMRLDEARTFRPVE